MDQPLGVVMRTSQLSLKRNFLLFAFGEISPKVLLLFLLPVYTRFLSPTDFGLVASLGVLAALIRRLKNHPSVVVWSVGNECESDNETARAVISDSIRFVKEKDSTRPVTYVSNYIYSKDRWCRCLDLGDFTSINAYFDLQVDRLREVLARIRKGNAGRAILITEFGAEAVRGIHGEFIGSEEHQADVIEKTWDLLSSEDVMGGLVWSFTDYWHQPRRLGTPFLNPVYFLHGILDLERRPKKAFKVLRRLYSEST